MNQFSSAKILRHLDRVAEWQKTGLSRPVTYELDMTNVCNSGCPFCFGFPGREDDRSSLSLPQAKDIIRQVSGFGGRGITFTGGGDPLCNPSTLEAVRFARKAGLDVGFITNGLLVDEQAARTLAGCCTWIRISLDAGSPAVYRRTHGLGADAFRRAVEGVRLLARSKRALKSGVTVGTGFLTATGAVRDMTAFVRVSRDAGADYAQFRPLLRKTGQREFNRAPDTRVLEAVDRCRKLSTRSFEVLCSAHKYEGMKNGASRRSYERCYGHHFAAVIAADRKMYLCCHTRGMEKYMIGDLAKQTLREIWESARRRRVYERIDFRDCPLFCRCDGFNTVLWNASRPAAHENFL